MRFFAGLLLFAAPTFAGNATCITNDTTQANCDARVATTMSQSTCEADGGTGEDCTFTAADCDTACTIGDAAVNGVCPGTSTNKSDGTVCNDGDANSDTDVCTAGVCAGTCNAAPTNGAVTQTSGTCVYTCDTGYTAKGTLPTGTCEPACAAKTNMTVTGNQTDANCTYSCVTDSTASGDIQILGTCTAVTTQSLCDTRVATTMDETTCETDSTDSPDNEVCTWAAGGTCAADACDALTNGTFTGDKIAGCVYECSTTHTSKGDIQGGGGTCEPACDAKTNMTVTGNKTDDDCAWTCVANSTASGDIQAASTCTAATTQSLCDTRVATTMDQTTCETDSTDSPDGEVCTWAAGGTCAADACDARANASVLGDQVTGCNYTCSTGYTENTDGDACVADSTDGGDDASSAALIASSLALGAAAIGLF